jgi:hypothetical protein
MRYRLRTLLIVLAQVRGVGGSVGFRVSIRSGRRDIEGPSVDSSFRDGLHI